MKYDGTGVTELASIVSKYAMLAVASASASHLTLTPASFGLPLPVLLTALVGALLSLLFMDPLEGKQRRFLPLTILTFALIGAAVTIGLQTFRYTTGAFGDVPAPMLALIISFVSHRFIPLLLVEGPALARAKIAKWRKPNA